MAAVSSKRSITAIVTTKTKIKCLADSQGKQPSTSNQAKKHVLYGDI